MQIVDQQNSLKTFLKNLPYINKPVVEAHLVRFVKENECFWVRNGVDRTANNQTYCFLEAAGFVNIDKAMIEVRIMLPHNYPLAPPQFDLVYNSSSFSILNEGALLSSQAIYLRKNQANEQLIRLNFDSIRRLWMTERKHICEAFRQICRDINSPPMLVPRLHQPESIIMEARHPRNGASVLTNKFMDQIESQIFSLYDKKGKVESIQKENQYREARVDFVQRNGPKLEKALLAEEGKVKRAMEGLRGKKQEMMIMQTVDPLLEMSERDKAKILALGRRQAVKQAERVVTECLQHSSLDTNTSTGVFEQQRNVIRMLYQQMFQAQLEYLKLCD